MSRSGRPAGKGVWIAAAVAALLGTAGCGARPAGDVTRARLFAQDHGAREWLTGGGDWRGGYYSTLTQINAGDVGRLGFAWAYDLQTDRGQESTPVVVDGVMYASTNWGRVVAVDAATGRARWSYDPQVDGQWGRYACCDVVNRGLAVWKGTVYVGSTDGFLHAIDAATGARRWKVDTLDSAARRRRTPYTISGAPQVAGDVVVIGNGGADFGVRGYVRAYDLRTGALRWTFYTVPHDPRSGPQKKPYLDSALKTWSPASDWSLGGGGTVWDGMAYDPRLDLLYIGTGNSSPYNYKDRSRGQGDNLYLASIVAIDPKTGLPRWHYQTVPAEAWDYTATQKMILADLRIGGRMRQVLMQAPKNGYFYVLDRRTGEVISAKPYTYVNWSSGIDPRTKRAIISPEADYASSPKLIYPSEAGGHNWQPMAYSPQTGLVYIPALDAPMVYVEAKDRRIGLSDGSFTLQALAPESYDRTALKPLLGSLPSMNDLVRTAGGPSKPSTLGVLRAWDPVAGRVVWEAPRSGYWDGGVMATAGGLVFSGDARGRLTVRRADDGRLLQTIETGVSIMAAPMTYMAKGQQYVAVLAGFGGGDGMQFPPDSAAYRYGNAAKILAFRLDGGRVPLPPVAPAPRFTEPPHPPPFTAAQASAGEVLYARHCGRCHVFDRGVLPDLRRIPNEMHGDFDRIVLGGLYSPLGMGNFSDILNSSDAHAIHAYISREQQNLYAREAAASARSSVSDSRRQRPHTIRAATPTAPVTKVPNSPST